MTPSQKTKVGTILVVLVLVALGAILALTMRRNDGASRGFEDSVVIEERLKRLGK